MSDIKINNITDRSGSSGPIFAGISTVSTDAFMVMPSGPTEFRGGRARLVFGGGYYPSPHANLNTLDFVEIATLGNAVDFGDKTVARTSRQMGSSSTRGIMGTGNAPGNPDARSVIDYITFQSGGGANDFGDLTAVPIKSAGFGNGVRGVFAGGYASPSDYTFGTIQYVNIATTGNSIIASGLLNGTEGSKSDGSVADSTRGCVGGLDIDTGTPSQTNAIHFITTTTLGDSQDFGDLTVARRCGNGVSSSTTRGLFYSGSPGPGPHRNTIDYITIQSLGNAIDFGDITTHNNQDGASHGSNLTRSVNRVNSDANTIEYVTIATLGNTIEFGDSTHVAASNLGIDNSNGSIG